MYGFFQNSFFIFFANWYSSKLLYFSQEIENDQIGRSLKDIHSTIGLSMFVGRRVLSSSTLSFKSVKVFCISALASNSTEIVDAHSILVELTFLIHFTCAIFCSIFFVTRSSIVSGLAQRKFVETIASHI
jgi:hypothetical protein